MTNKTLFLLIALIVSTAPAYCANASDKGHDESLSKPTAGETTTQAESPAGSAATNNSPTSDSGNPAADAQKSSTAAEATKQTGAGSTGLPVSAWNSNLPSAASKSSPNASPSDSSQPPAAAAKAPSVLPSEVAPGHYENDRKKVRNWLLEANRRGVGLAAYMPVWDDMEAAVKSGAPEATVKTKLDGICHSIGEQVRNSSKMAVFRPAKPKPIPKDENEIGPLRWVGPKTGEPEFRNIADKWLNDSVDRLTPEQRTDSFLRRRLYDQRDAIFNEMTAKRKRGEMNATPIIYSNMNQDINQNLYKPANSANYPYQQWVEHGEAPQKNKH